MAKGILYLIPTPLGEGSRYAQHFIDTARKVIEPLDGLFVENKRTARSHLKQLHLHKKINEILIVEIGKSKNEKLIEGYLQSIAEGQRWGIMSEAGCPGIADPGADLVRTAHAWHIRTVPLIGPSS
ncbi:MAG: SAM-dependent methyltransferase, partial [bacterium]